MDDGTGAMVCARCGERFDQQGGMFRFLSARRAAAAAPFLQQYRLVRDQDGHRSPAPEYYRSLPLVPRDDPQAAEWRVRRESYEHLSRYALPAVWRGPVQILDLGAGNGWLSHRLAALGHRVAAVDCLDDDQDGLGACRHYAAPFVAVQADFDALPFEPSQFDLVVFNGSLHYSAHPAATLAGARRVLAPTGAVAVMDSPMFAHEQDGEAMVAEQLARIAATHGIDAIRPGIGFVTWTALEQSAKALGLRGRFFRSRGPIAWRLRRQLSQLKIGRSPAAFGVWVAR